MTREHERAIRQANADVSYAIADGLARGGVRHVVVAPGSRSTPLVIALCSSGFEVEVVSDERSAAFFALGLGRASEAPALVVTTSGTATANLFPAIVEASRDCVPMLALTADRPLELVGSGANQTIDQRGLYGRFVRHDCELAADVGCSPRAVTARVQDAVRASLEATAGPVHINVRLRKPLEIEARMMPCVVAEPPFAPARRALTDPDARRVRERIEGVERGLLVVGALRRRDDVAAARRVAERLGWPTHASILSGLRCDGRGAELPPPPDDDYGAELVVHLGGPCVSTAIDALVARAGSVLRVGAEARHAADAADESALPCDLAFFAERCVPERACRPAGPRAEAHVRDDEARIAVEVAASTRRGEALLIGNSAPIRDVDDFVPELAAARVFANRGASGIDGGIATACGVARAHGAPVTALLGDLSFLHDVGSLALLAQRALPLRVVVVDNRGGGLFRRLPIARCEEHEALYRDCIVAPHAHDLVAIARGFGLAARRVDAPEDLRDACREAPAAPELLVCAVPEASAP